MSEVFKEWPRDNGVTYQIASCELNFDRGEVEPGPIHGRLADSTGTLIEGSEITLVAPTDPPPWYLDFPPLPLEDVAEVTMIVWMGDDEDVPIFKLTPSFVVGNRV